MNRLTLALSLLIAFSISAQTNISTSINSNAKFESTELDTEKRELEEKIFDTEVFKGEPLKISDIKVVEVEEDVDLGFDPKMYLPTNFNPYKGMKCKKQRYASI